jgi:two-component system response regulator AtoC
VLSLPAPVDRAWEPERVLPEFAARLDVIRIELPPLRERRDDVVPLARHFLRKYAQRNARAAVALSAGAEHALLGYDFPGNARELENVIERAAVLARGDVIGPEHLAFPSHDASNPADLPPRALEADAPFAAHPARGDLPTRLDDLERRELLAALERCGGNKAEVARSLGLQRTTLYYRLKRLGIEA